MSGGLAYSTRMPAISTFFGIVIEMFWREHGPPHFHATYGEYEAVIAIDTLDILRGELPRRAKGLVMEWANDHRDALQKNWDLCSRHARRPHGGQFRSAPGRTRVSSFDSSTARRAGSSLAAFSPVEASKGPCSRPCVTIAFSRRQPSRRALFAGRTEPILRPMPCTTRSVPAVAGQFVRN